MELEYWVLLGLVLVAWDVLRLFCCMFWMECWEYFPKNLRIF